MSAAMEWDDILWTDVPVVTIDTETTGFGREDRIIEIALVLAVNGETTRELHTLVNPGRSVPQEVTATTGITDDDLIGAPEFEDILDDVLELLTSEAPWAAHNMHFDARMLSREIPAKYWPSGIPTLCTLDYAKHRNAATKMRGHHKLADLANYFYVDFDPDELHNALYDATLLAQIVPKLMGTRQVGRSMTRWSEEWKK